MGCFQTNNLEEGASGMKNLESLQSLSYIDDGISSMLELHLSCSNVKSNSFWAAENLMIKVYSSLKDNLYSEVGKTETMKFNKDPKFVNSVIFKFMFEEKQKIKFELCTPNTYYQDDKGCPFIGTCLIEPHEIIRAPKQELTRPIISNSNEKLGDLTVFAESVSKKISSNLVFLEFEGSFKKISLYFIKIYRQKDIDSPEFIPIYKTETQDSSKGVIKWGRIKVGAASLLKDDLNSNIKIEIWEISKTGNHIMIGEKITNFKSFMDLKPTISIGKNGLDYVKPISVIFEERFAFVEYLFAGLNIAMILAIDFTASNMDPSNPHSLHYFDPQKNQYIAAISSVGSILEYYDTDKMIPVLGFGARIQNMGDVTSHCFALNGNIFAPEVPGIYGVLDLYKKNLMKLKFSGPTHFSSILRYVSNMVEAYMKRGFINTFFVLMIITDGEIHDMNETIDEIVRSSHLPLEIIIVGVGNEEFKNMDILDADDVPLVSSKYGKMKSDIVQFVPLRNYINNPQMLASETLQELPRQVSDFMKSVNANPQTITSMSNVPSFNYFEFTKQEFISTYSNEQQNNYIADSVNKGIPSTEMGFFNQYLRSSYFNPLVYKKN